MLIGLYLVYLIIAVLYLGVGILALWALWQVYYALCGDIVEFHRKLNRFKDKS